MRRDRERQREGGMTRRGQWVAKEVTQCLLGHSTLDPLRRIFSGRVSLFLSFCLVQQSDLEIIVQKETEDTRWPLRLGPSKRFILSEIEQAAPYNTHQNVASPHRSITAALEERSTTSLVPHYHDQICSYCFFMLPACSSFLS